MRPVQSHQVIPAGRDGQAVALVPVAPAELQERYALVSDDAPFSLVLPDGDRLSLVVASEGPARGRLVERSSGAVVAVVDSPGGVARYSVGA